MIIVGTNIKLSFVLTQDRTPLNLTDITDVTLMLLKPNTSEAIELAVSIIDPLIGSCYALINASTLDTVGDWKSWAEIPSANYISMAKNFKVYPVGTIG